jgi:hypothetical protein
MAERFEAGWRALRWPGSVVWVVAALAALALGLRLACVGQSLFGDELFLYVDVHGRSLGQLFSLVHDTEKTPPLGFVLGWLFARGGSATELVRVPSLVASVATVPLIYLLGSRTVGRGAGVVAAAWFAISPFEIFYGTEDRGYALVAALVVLSTLSLLAALEERRLRWWVLYGFAAAAAVYTHYTAALTLVPQAAWALWTHRESAREQLVANGLVVLAFLPWLPSFLVQIRHSGKEALFLSQVVPLTASRVAKISGQSLVGHPFLSLSQLPGRGTLAILAAVVVVLLSALGYGLWRGTRRFRPTLSTRRGLVVLLALAPLVGLVLYSARPHVSFLLARNLSVAVPYALLLFGWLLTWPRPCVAAALSVAALAAVALGTVKVLSPDYQRPDARDAARYIDARAAPTTPVIDWEVLCSDNCPPARATQLYLERPHRIYMREEALSGWAAATRAHVPVVITGPAPILLILAPPPRYAPRYRLAAQHTSRGAPYEIVTREFVPR